MSDTNINCGTEDDVKIYVPRVPAEITYTDAAETDEVKIYGSKAIS